MPSGGWNKLDPEEKARRNRERCKAYHAAHREQHKVRCKSRYYSNHTRMLLEKKQWYLNNKATHRARMKIYENTHKDKINSSKAKWRARVVAERPEMRIKSNLRARVHFAVKHQGACKHHKSLSVLGCSVEQLMTHLEVLFKKGMSWDNYGPAWHIDHILPCSSFNLIDPEEQSRCFHFSNLQPLWKMDNFIKNDRLPDGRLGRYINN